MGDGTEDRKRVAIIPTNGRKCFDDCLAAIFPQVNYVVVVDTSEDYEVTRRTPIEDVIVLQAIRTEPNISAWWNQGLNTTRTLARHSDVSWTSWDVAILNDDAVVPDGWFAAVANNMRQHGAVAGCSGHHDVVLRQPEAVPLDYRMQGYAFILKGEANIRAYEKLHWYFSDDYIDWESRKAGGMAMVSGYLVQHLHPNGQMTPELHAQTARDADEFFSLYGRMPW